MIEVTYITELPQMWAKTLDAADSLESLKDAVDEYREYVGDAEEVVRTWDEATFADWRKALYLERHGRFMGEQRAESGMAVVMMPTVLLGVSLVAGSFHVPWGLAFIRMRDVGRVLQQDGYFVLAEEDEAVSA